MRLTVTRSQMKMGMVSKNVTFLVIAKLELSEEEKFAVDEYTLGDLVIYNSEKAQKHLQGYQNSSNTLSSLARAAMASMSLKLTISNLTMGQTVKCSNLDEAIAAEEAIKEACENIKIYIAVAQTYDGREEVFEF